MTDTSYNVQIWETKPRKNASGKVTSYRVRWRVGTHEHHESFKGKTLASSFHAQLVTAASKGEAFLVDEPGLPVSMTRATANQMSWFDFACAYVDMKWPHTSPGHRKSTADSLIVITSALLTTENGKPDQKVTNSALRTAFSSRARNGEHPDEIRRALRWIADHTHKVSALAKPELLRDVLRALDLKQSGERAAPDTIRLRRTTFRGAIDYAIEKKLLTANPLDEVKVNRNTATLKQVDRRSVANPFQARMLLHAVQKRSDRLTAFFALLYYAALRPEEATNIGKRNLAIPAEGWGELHLDKATPEIAEPWSDSGARSEPRNLKHRVDSTGRVVPCPPELTALLHRHIAKHGTAPDGRLFAGVRNGGRLGSSVYGRVWAQARADVFTKEVQSSPLAKRPYDLRHAAVSTWLNAGVEATRIAEWAGHSVHVLLRVYAKCLDGGEQAARERVQRALGG
ncbi:tyrosine-type recombinase/integrase [Saccharopolyspora gloriosae]|uniref:tyrosine-type recombinase/integrase n=1 Tax=Saccharopolyspora gloriosae TaxID=455344 RepID=UPI001FB82688|nr:tyrosine-type recombinase/integrase [Saccharopolyspora gloriosae]